MYKFFFISCTSDEVIGDEATNQVNESDHLKNDIFATGEDGEEGVDDGTEG